MCTCVKVSVSRSQVKYTLRWACECECECGCTAYVYLGSIFCCVCSCSLIHWLVRCVLMMGEVAWFFPIQPSIFIRCESDFPVDEAFQRAHINLCTNETKPILPLNITTVRNKAATLDAMQYTSSHARSTQSFMKWTYDVQNICQNFRLDIYIRTTPYFYNSSFPKFMLFMWIKAKHHCCGTA